MSKKQEDLNRAMLCCIATCPDEEYISELLRKGADPNAQNSHGETGLMLASDPESIGIVRALIRSGADVGIQDKEGRTAMMFHAAAGSIETLKILIDNAPLEKIKRVDNQGMNVADIAYKAGHHEIYYWMKTAIEIRSQST